jgi:hypothetical protein
MNTFWLEKARLRAISAVVVAAIVGTAGWVPGSAEAQIPSDKPTPPVPPMPQPPNTHEAPRAARPVAPPVTPEQAAAQMAAYFDRLFGEALKQSALAEAAPTDDELQKLRKQRYQSARTELTARLQGFVTGAAQETIDVLADCITKRLLPAELALSDRPAEKVTAYERSLSILKGMESVQEARYRGGRISIRDLEQARFERLGMEVKVLEVKQVVPAQPNR